MRSIQRSKNFAPLIKKLTNKNTSTGVEVFSTIKALQCYAAVLGFQEDRKESFDKDEKENIDWYTFDNDEYTDYIYMIAFAHTQSLKILKYDVNKSDSENIEQDMVKIFEEYAHGGFIIMQSWLDKDLSDVFGSRAIIAGLGRSKYY